MTPTEMKQLLAAENIRLTKSLGQNFLHDANQLRRIVAAADLSKQDKVLEIGPGLGPLTELLMQQAGEVLAIEKDAGLIKLLEQRFRVGQASRLPPAAQRAGTDIGEMPVLRLLHDDALGYLRRERRDWSEWKLVSNLPYSVASPILVELAEGSRGPQRMVATLQIEVAKRLFAKHATPDYGRLTLLVQLDYEPQRWFKIPASCFFPEPDVDSACVCLTRRQPALLPAEGRETFTQLVKRSFSQRRKMMLKLLKEDWPESVLLTEFERLKLSPHVRAEEVSLEQFTQLTQSLRRGQCSSASVAPACFKSRQKEPINPASFGMPFHWPPTPSPICDNSHSTRRMSEEIFDVVNEVDEVVGQRSRREVHRLGLMHRAVHVLVFNAAGQVFLQKRSMSKDRQPGLWDSSASGHVDAGEDYDACAVRELREEIGLELNAPPQRLFKLGASAETDQEHVWVYRCEAEGPFRLEPGEIERGGWYAATELTRWMAERPQDFASTLLLIWKRVGRI